MSLSADLATQTDRLVASRRTIEQIAGALRRIAEGTYGVCRQCGRDIPVERQEVLPHALLRAVPGDGYRMTSAARQPLFVTRER